MIPILGLTEDRHIVVHFDNDPPGEELAGEEKEVGVVEHDEELHQLAVCHLAVVVVGISLKLVTTTSSSQIYHNNPAQDF